MPARATPEATRRRQASLHRLRGFILVNEVPGLAGAEVMLLPQSYRMRGSAAA